MACAEQMGLKDLSAAEARRSGLEAAQKLLGTALAEKIDQCEARIFILLGILYPEADVELIYAGIRDASAQDASRRRANAIELLDNVLDRALRRKLFPLLEDLPREAKLRSATEDFPPPPLSQEDRLRELLSDESAWVRSCSLFLAGEVADPALQESVVENLDHPSAVVRETSIACLQRLMTGAALRRLVERRVGDESEAVRARARLALGTLALAEAPPRPERSP